MRVHLNNDKYRYDIFQIINIFYQFSDIIFTYDKNDEYDLNIEIYDDNIVMSYNDIEKIYYIKNDIKIKQYLRKCLYLFLKDITQKSFAWGTIIGIRPSKIALELLNENKSEEEILNYYSKHFLTSKEKAELCIKIARKEGQYVNKSAKNISVYIDMPFCPSRCLYCSFASNPIVRCKKIVEPYLEALYFEMEQIYKFIDKNNLNIECVYFGGGTPTSINDKQFNTTMKNIFKYFVENRNIKEFTVECGRPDSINANKLNSMKKYKTTRISINPQTMNDKTLKLIGRNHSSQDVIDKFNLARSLGFDNINMDLILGLPGETLDDVKKTCRQIFSLKPDDVTVHGLCIKRGSRLHEDLINNGKFDIPSQEEIEKIYSEVEKLTEKLNLEPYYMYRQKNMVGNMQNVGYCKKGKEGIYNIEMIEEKQTIIAIGADAITKCVFLDENRIERFANMKDVNEYIKRINSSVEKKINLLNTIFPDIN